LAVLEALLELALVPVAVHPRVHAEAVRLALLPLTVSELKPYLADV
jgi:hypothetical protein